MQTYTLDEDFLYEESEEDELDLFKLVSTDSNDMNQYLLFRGSSLEWYAMNVSKIEEVIIFDKGMQIARNNDSDNIIIGTADIRGSMTPLIYFDTWYENDTLEDSAYELIILANYGGHRFGIIIKEVSSITIIEANSMSDNSQNNLKSTFISKVLIDTSSEMCTIYDGDKMLLDVFDSVQEKANYDFDAGPLAKVTSKTIFFADDSRFVRSLVEELFGYLGVTYKMFNDGATLADYLDKHPGETVDLFITDLEMPKMGGRELILNIKARDVYKKIPILVHTNMSNNAMETELAEIGATGIIGKINMSKLGRGVIKLLSKTK